MTARLAALGIGVLALVLTVGLYLPALDNGFICDDYSYLAVGRAILAEPALILRQAPVYDLYIGARQRPLGNVLWAGLVGLFGTRPQPYYLLLLGLHLANVALLAAWLRRVSGCRLTAALGAGLFATAYGARDAVVWLSNLNESLCLTGALALLLLRERLPATASSRAGLTGGVIAVCLVKESIAPVWLLLVTLDALDTPWRDLARRWWPAAGLFAGYAIWRLSGPRQAFYADYGAGPWLLTNVPVLLAAGFGSDLLGVWFDRRLGAPELLPLVSALVWAGCAWLAVRGRGPARGLAWWMLFQPLAFAPMANIDPLRLPTRYLYLATAPAMGLVALGLVGLWRVGRERRAVTAVALVLTLALARWQVYGLVRNRLDEALHWQVATTTLRRDMAALDAAAWPAGARILLLMPPDEVPAAGAWWGWEGYPLVASRLCPELRRHVGVAPPADYRPPFALFRYSKELGPIYEGIVE